MSYAHVPIERPTVQKGMIEEQKLEADERSDFELRLSVVVIRSKVKRPS